MLSLFQILTLENWPAYLEAGQAVHPASWIFFVSYVLIASFLVINILIAIIINSMEEVHDAEKAADRKEIGGGGGDGRGTDSGHPRGARSPGDAARRGWWRRSGAGEVRSAPPDEGRADARLSRRYGLSSELSELLLLALAAAASAA